MGRDMTFEELGKLKYDINKAYSKKFSEVVESMKDSEFSSLSEQIKTRQEALREYIETVHSPAQKQLREECTKLGHKAGSNDISYHRNVIGGEWLVCCYCGIALRWWLDGIELKVINGEPVNNGKNWIKIDGTLGISCVDCD